MIPNGVRNGTNPDARTGSSSVPAFLQVTMFQAAVGAFLGVNRIRAGQMQITMQATDHGFGFRLCGVGRVVDAAATLEPPYQPDHDAQYQQVFHKVRCKRTSITKRDPA